MLVPSACFVMGDNNAVFADKIGKLSGETYSFGAIGQRKTCITYSYRISRLVSPAEICFFLNDVGEKEQSDYVGDSDYSNVVYKHGVGFVSMNESDKPFNALTYLGAISYSDWLAEKIGLDVRLPTEAEWELASQLSRLAGENQEYTMGSWCSDYYDSKLDLADNIDPSGPLDSTIKLSNGVKTRVIRRATSTLKPRYPGAESVIDGAIYGLQVVIESSAERAKLNDEDG